MENEKEVEIEIEKEIEIERGKLYQKRARTAHWSMFWLGASSLFSLISFALTRSVEDFIALVLLGAMTIVEINVKKWFLEGNTKGAIYGYWNQTLFALLFLLYGGYHFFDSNTTPKEINSLSNPGIDIGALYQEVAKITYATIGIVGGACQYLLALHYKRALKI